MRRSAITTFVIDSRDRPPGADQNDFALYLSPALRGVRCASLVFADIPSPPENVEPYWLLSIPELGMTVRSARAGSATFIIPTTAAAGYRVYHQDGSDFAQVATGAPGVGVTLSQLNVRLHWSNGRAAAPAGDWTAILRLEC